MDTNTSLSVLDNFVTPWDLQTQKSNNTTKYSHNSHMVQKQHISTKVPKSFIWSHGDFSQSMHKLNAPTIDLEGFIRGDELATKHAAKLTKEACSRHGFFQVINHGIELELIDEAYNNIDYFLKLPKMQKAKALKKYGEVWGLSIAHADRLSSNLPWKETLSFPYYANNNNHNNSVVNYFTSVMGSEFEPMGIVYQKYCNEMHKLCMVITELMAISLEIDGAYFRDYFEIETKSIMRLNYYPPCDEPSLVLGTGPHCDPTALTVLYQDQVGGLEVFVDNKWQSIEPRPQALVVNVGDTFMAMTNGEYKSCLHRTLLNEKIERKTMAFFLCPRADKVVRPTPSLSNNNREIIRKYPDFMWSEFFNFTQTHYQPNENSFQSFINSYHMLKDKGSDYSKLGNTNLEKKVAL